MTRSASAAASRGVSTLSPASLAFVHALGARAQADAHVDARVVQVERVRVTLAAVTDDRDLLAQDDGLVAILLVVDRRHAVRLPSR